MDTKPKVFLTIFYTFDCRSLAHGQWPLALGNHSYLITHRIGRFDSGENVSQNLPGCQSKLPVANLPALRQNFLPGPTCAQENSKKTVWVPSLGRVKGSQMDQYFDPKPAVVF